MKRRQRFQPIQSLEERLIEQATRLRAEANALPLGAARCARGYPKPGRAGRSWRTHEPVAEFAQCVGGVPPGSA